MRALHESVFANPASRRNAPANPPAIALARSGDIIWEHVSHAHLTMRALSSDFIHRHLNRVGEKALSSVGAYQLEGEGIQLFSKIDGDYFTIVGLPMVPLLEKLRELGAIDG